MTAHYSAYIFDKNEFVSENILCVSARSISLILNIYIQLDNISIFLVKIIVFIIVAVVFLYFDINLFVLLVSRVHNV